MANFNIINQNFSPETPKGMNETRHIKMLIDDISEPREGFILPQKHHAQALLDFTDGDSRPQKGEFDVYPPSPR